MLRVACVSIGKLVKPCWWKSGGPDTRIRSRKPFNWQTETLKTNIYHMNERPWCAIASAVICSSYYLFRIIVDWMWWRARGRCIWMHVCDDEWNSFHFIHIINNFVWIIQRHLMLAKWFRTLQSIETMSRIRCLQGHATIIYEHIKINSKIERTRRCRGEMPWNYNIQAGLRSFQLLSFGGEWSNCIHCCASTATTHFFLIIVIRCRHRLLLTFNGFIKFGLFAILFLIFIGIKLIANAGEDYVRADAVVSSMDAVGQWPKTATHGIMSFVFIFFII